MKILVINAGSSSLKYQLINMQDESVILKGVCERITAKGGILTQKTFDDRKVVIEQDMPTHKEEKNNGYNGSKYQIVFRHISPRQPTSKQGYKEESHWLFY